MAVDIIASSGVFDDVAEQAVCRGVFDALLAAVDATDDERIASTIGVALHVVPAQRVMMGGRVASSVRIDVVVPGIALASFRRPPAFHRRCDRRSCCERRGSVDRRPRRRAHPARGRRRLGDRRSGVHPTTSSTRDPNSSRRSRTDAVELEPFGLAHERPDEPDRHETNRPVDRKRQRRTEGVDHRQKKRTTPQSSQANSRASRSTSHGRAPLADRSRRSGSHKIGPRLNAKQPT